eukprot:6174412-Pleurochrysis_carterae.AAC.1
MQDRLNSHLKQLAENSRSLEVAPFRRAMEPLSANAATLKALDLRCDAGGASSGLKSSCRAQGQ